MIGSVKIRRPFVSEVPLASEIQSIRLVDMLSAKGLTGSERYCSRTVDGEARLIDKVGVNSKAPISLAEPKGLGAPR